KLEKVRNELQIIQKPFNTTTRILALNFTSTHIYTQCEQTFRELDPDIHVLVNNVGMGYQDGIPVRFGETPNLDQFCTDMINVNIMSCTRLTALVLPAMVFNGQGVIINVSSFAANLPIPLLSQYSATKAYMDYFSRGLAVEYNDRGIIVQSVMPNVVSTKMVAQPIRNSSFIPSARDYVRHTIRTVGFASRTAGYPSHRIAQIFYDFVAFISDIIGVNLGQKLTKLCERLGQILMYLIAIRLIIMVWRFIKNYNKSDVLVGNGCKWAVITGATDGIGLAYAHELALRQYNLLLISRSQEKLEKELDSERAYGSRQYDSQPQPYGSRVSRSLEV
ncbi:unnamed protein product, partial [Oppiella nova]